MTSPNTRMTARQRALILGCLTPIAALLASCASEPTGTDGNSFKNNPCVTTGTVTLGVAESTRIDCSAGGTVVTVAGNGATYLVVPEFATDQAATTPVRFTLSSGTVVAAAASPSGEASASRASTTGGSTLATARTMLAQMRAEAVLRGRMRDGLNTGRFATAMQRAHATAAAANLAMQPLPAAGSTRAFRVASSFTSGSFKTVGAKLLYVGANVLLYVDTLAPANGYSAQQLTDFGALFDQTLYPIDTAAFGPPTDVDANGHIIMLMSPVVNGITSTSSCNTSGYVAGFFNTQDFDGAEPRMVVRANHDDIVRIAKSAGVVGTLLDYDPTTQKYASSGALA